MIMYPLVGFVIYRCIELGAIYSEYWRIIGRPAELQVQRTTRHVFFTDELTLNEILRVRAQMQQRNPVNSWQDFHVTV